MVKKKIKTDWYFLGLTLLFFILGAIFDHGIFYLAAWTMIIVEIFYILLKTW
jgi:hypothetical protein